MNVKAVDSPSSDLLEADESQGVTLAIALEEARASKEACLKIYSDMMEEMDLFRLALKKQKEKKPVGEVDPDWPFFAGLALVSVGVAVRYHWAYSLIVVGIVLASLAILLPLLRRAPPASK